MFQLLHPLTFLLAKSVFIISTAVFTFWVNDVLSVRPILYIIQILYDRYWFILLIYSFLLAFFEGFSLGWLSLRNGADWDQGSCPAVAQVSMGFWSEVSIGFPGFHRGRIGVKEGSNRGQIHDHAWFQRARDRWNQEFDKKLTENYMKWVLTNFHYMCCLSNKT